MEYPIWYNTEKPHRGIQNSPPLRFYVDHFLAPQQSNMLWTLTSACLDKTAVVRLFSGVLAGSAAEALREMRYYRFRANLQFNVREDPNRHACLAAKRALVKRDKGSDKTTSG